MAELEREWGFMITLLLLVLIGLIVFFLFIHPIRGDEKDIKKIKISFEVGDYDLTLNLITDFLAEYENSKYQGQALVYAAEILYLRKDYEGAKKYIAKVIASEYANVNDFTAAVAILGKILKDTRKFDPIILDYLENAYLKAGSDLRPQLAAYLGYAYLFKGEHKTAIDYFNHSLGEYAILGRAKVYIDQKNFAQAIQEYENFLNVYSNSKEFSTVKDEFLRLCFDYAYSLQQNKQYKTAIDYYLKIVNRFPNDEISDNALFQIGMVYYVNKNYDHALFFYQKALTNKPTNADAAALFQKGVIYYETDQKENAYKHFSRLKEEYPSTVYASRAHEWIDLIVAELKN